LCKTPSTTGQGRVGQILLPLGAVPKLLAVFRKLGLARRLLIHLELLVAIPLINVVEATAAVSAFLYRRDFLWIPTTK